MFSLLGLFKLAFANLRINKLRSSLTVLGMVFGTGAVIATLSSNEGAARFIQDELAKLGTNLVSIRSQDPNHPFTESDLALIRKYSQKMESVSLVQEVKNAEARFNANIISVRLTGVSGSYFPALRLILHRGRLFTQSEETECAFVGLVGHTTKLKLFGNRNPIGNFVHVYIGEASFVFQIIGEFKEKGGSSSTIDWALYIPTQTAIKIASVKGRSSHLEMTLKSSDQALQAKTEIQHLISRKFPSGLVISDAREAIEQTKGIWEKQNLVGICLALISLLTGGVGIMNIMLLSVSQRRKEIGLRKAVGANEMHILTQFLLEAVLVCLIGGFAGIAVGIFFGQQVAQMMGQWNAVVSLSTVFYALGFAMLTGVVFGLFPALRASRLDPYEALRT